jgi:hypothetical protein
MGIHAIKTAFPAISTSGEDSRGVLRGVIVILEITFDPGH